MFHCRSKRSGCRKSYRAQVLSCTDCSRARVGVYHRTWARGTAAPAEPPCVQLTPSSRSAAITLEQGSPTRPPRQPLPLLPRPARLSPPSLPPRSVPITALSSPRTSAPRHSTQARPPPRPVRSRSNFFSPPWAWAPSPGLGSGGTKFPAQEPGTSRHPHPTPILPPRDPALHAPYPHFRGSGGWRCAPRLGGRGPLPRVRTWPGLRPLHSARCSH